LDCFLIGCLTPVFTYSARFYSQVFGGEAGNRGSLCRCFLLLALHLVSSDACFC